MTQKSTGRVRIEAPIDMDELAVAQAVVGPHVLLKAEPKSSWETRPFVVWKPLQEMYEHVLATYDRHIKRLLQDIKDVMGLSKAAVKPPLTPKQVREIAKLIRDYHTAFVISMAGPEYVDEAELKDLVRRKILPPEVRDVIKDAYLYGQLVATIREVGAKDVKEWGYDRFKRHVAKRPIPLSAEEKNAIEWSKHSAAVHIQGLGNRISDDFTSVAIEADAEQRREAMGMIREEVAVNIDRRETVRKLASELGHATQDWSRDLGRIAATEKQQAFQEGFVQGLIKQEDEDPENIYVAKIPKPDACPDCVRLHMTAGMGSKPRIFTLSTLIGNGSNRGVKRRNWKAVVGTVHPWCACELVHVPPGWDFEDEPDEPNRYTKVKGKKAWTKKDGKPWRPRIVPDSLRRGDIFKRDLMKSFMTYGESVPTHGVSIRISDPEIVREVEGVIRKTPSEIFHKDVGVTLITTDHPRPQVALDEHDLAYWTGNEIRLSTELPANKVAKVLCHELGHALNVYLMKKMGGEAPVRDWHKALYQISSEEGFVSDYARTLPIENAAEATRMYLYHRHLLMLEYPRTFSFLHEAYRGIWRRHAA